ncbi:nucleoside-triphosphatase [Intestinimonas sp.]|uniref:nucleoside-triphosphatase n=1 Tax=Intestinimonas sp. TaxID=1965293 RepID=UPI002632DA7B|nr:nucleoside-triphosphatase [Intestinimonas sp.]
MYLFLTGPSGVGKSTAADRTLSRLGIVPGGFRTGFAPDRKRLCLWPAWEQPDWSEKYTVARLERGRLTGDPAAFDRLGPAILAESRPWAPLMLLDELGWLEREALAFQGAVRACLEGPVPVLGVVKPAPQRSGTWLEELTQLPGGVVVTVDPVCRDGLPDLLAARLGNALGHSGKKKQERDGKRP